ncbi:hypothetical protein F4802DRAFT_561235 [Xylaria palmicola]|nr:hypothetical protein F4802DRAFT_561235 [Xylaria palmicola]
MTWTHQSEGRTATDLAPTGRRCADWPETLPVATSDYEPAAQVPRNSDSRDLVPTGNQIAHRPFAGPTLSARHAGPLGSALAALVAPSPGQAWLAWRALAGWGAGCCVLVLRPGAVPREYLADLGFNNALLLLSARRRPVSLPLATGGCRSPPTALYSPLPRCHAAMLPCCPARCTLHAAGVPSTPPCPLPRPCARPGLKESRPSTASPVASQLASQPLVVSGPGRIERL